MSTKNGTFLDSQGGWGGGDDSFYEYLIKMYVYDPEAYGEYKDRWVAAVDSTIDHLLSHPTSRKDLTFLSGYNGKKTNPSSGHCELRRAPGRAVSFHMHGVCVY